jgi:Fe-S cluster biogenesis protein NfuA
VDDREARELVGRIEALLEGADDAATELVAALLDLYGEGLARVVAWVPDPSELAGDELVSHLLLLHGLHPIALEDRVRGALAEVRPYLDSHGGDVELIGVEDGVVRLRLEGSCSGCASSQVTLKLAIEDAIRKAAPDVEEIDAEGAVPANGLPMAEPSWTDAGGAPDDGPLVSREIGGRPVLLVRLESDVYAYRPGCPECGGTLDLQAAWLHCEACGHHYDVRHAGRCLDAPDLHLDPVPLLVDQAGAVKVAL